MPCDMKMRREQLRPALAEQGWSDDEITLLEKEVELAVAKANKQAADFGLDKMAQSIMEEAADQKARAVAHERMHAKLNTIMDQIIILKAQKKAHV